MYVYIHICVGMHGFMCVHASVHSLTGGRWTSVCVCPHIDMDVHTGWG